MAVIKKYNTGTSTWDPIVVGKQGPVGEGVPVGGTSGQVLAKSSGTDYATEWVTPAPVRATLNDQTGTTYTLALTDENKLVTFDNAAAITVTVPTDASVAFPVGSKVDLAQIGAGQVTVAGDSGVTVQTAQTLLLRAQWSGASLVKIDTDEWLLVGDLEAA